MVYHKEHGGDLIIASEHGKGTTVRLIVPVDDTSGLQDEG